MSVGSFILGGVGGGSTVALFINEGFGELISAPGAAAIGGMIRHGKRKFEITVDGVRFTARSPQLLQAKIAAWRRGHIPANDPRPQPKPAKEVVPDTSEARSSQPDSTAPQATVSAPGAAPLALVPPLGPEAMAVAALAAQQQIAAELAMAAQKEALEREVAVMLALRAAEEEDDWQALQVILEAAA